MDKPPFSDRFQIRHARPEDADRIIALYKKVARDSGGIARSENEITREYITENIENASKRGFCLVIEEKKSLELVAEIHCYRPEPKVFAHVLGELTVVVDPSFQGQGLGKMLFEKLFQLVEAEHPDILRIELISRESNKRAIDFYFQIGFVVEGRLEKRIATTDGLEADIPMAWFNPSYSKKI